MIDVFAPEEQSSLFVQWGPPPLPWRMQNLFLFPRPEVAAKCIPVLIEQECRGVFLALANDTEISSRLQSHVLWSIHVDITRQDLDFQRLSGAEARACTHAV
jgi:hypothetical protein